VAGWFFAGTPDDGDIVHWGCRFARVPFAHRERRRLARLAALAADPPSVGPSSGGFGSSLHSRPLNAKF
jgi:hypothetical protein